MIIKIYFNKVNAKKLKTEILSFVQMIHFQLSPFYFMAGAVVVYLCLDAHYALAAGDNLGDFVGGMKNEANGISRNAVGTAATAGFGLMSLGAGNTGKMVAMTGIAGTVGYMVWPMIERKMMSISGAR